MKKDDNYLVSYAQNREDIIIAQFFKDINKGFYVDIGANDPVDDSVTKYFYEKGWNGINIEPNKNLFEKLEHARPRDINLNIGIAEKEGKLTLRQYVNHGLSTFSDDIKTDYNKDHSDKTDNFEDVTVPVSRLEKVLKEHAPKKINFMKIDVEGFEYEVINSSDWGKFRPELLCIESNHIKKDWRVLLEKSKYELVFFDGINNYYLAQESIKRNEKFDYAEAFLLGKQTITPGIANQLDMLDKALNELSNIQQKLNTTQSNYEEALRQRNDIFNELQKFQGFKRQLRMLLGGLYSRLDIMAESLSYSLDYNYPEATIGKTEDFNELNEAIQRYDEAVLTEKRLVGAKWRRALSYMIKLLLAITKTLVKFAVRVLKKMKSMVKST
jgi:FkbM family methyltransferase